MLRSLLLILLLATSSLANNFEHTTEHQQNFEVIYSLHNCEDRVDTMIQTQIHETITKIAGREFNRPVQKRGKKDDRRQLRTPSASRELYIDCSAPCGCYEYLACRVIQPWNCVDTCGHDCTCVRRLEEDEPRLLHKFGETANAEGAGTDECDKWDQGNLTFDEMDNILSCSATKAIKEEMAAIFNEEGSCLGDSDQFEALVTVFGS